MKKPSRSASKKNTKKPVTIELKAESVASAAKTKSTSKTSVPRTSKVDTSKQSTSSTSGSAKSDSPKSVFGRGDGQTSSSSQQNQKAKPAVAPTKPSTSKPKDEPKSTSGLSRFAAALLGGAVALGGAGALQYTGILSSPNSPDSVSANAFSEKQNEMSEQITALQSNISEISSGSTSGLDKAGIESLIDGKIAEIPKPLGGEGNPDMDAITTQVNETTIRVETLQSEIAALSTTVSSLNTAVSSGTAGDTAGLTSLTSRIDDVSGKLESLATEMTGLKAETLEMANRPMPQPAGLSETISGLASLKAALPTLKAELSAELDQLKTGLEIIKTTSEKQTSSLSHIEDKVSLSENVRKQAASAIAAAALKSDIDQGIPFSASLATLEGVAGASDDLTKLKGFAETGVPTISQLTSDFGPVGQQIVAALTPKPKEDLASRLMAGAKSFVSVKHIGPVQGDTPLALVSRLSEALEAGKASEAAKLWAVLPEIGQTVSAKWHSRLQARISTNSLIDSTVQSFVLSSATQ